MCQWNSGMEFRHAEFQHAISDMVSGMEF